MLYFRIKKNRCAPKFFHLGAHVLLGENLSVEPRICVLLYVLSWFSIFLFVCAYFSVCVCVLPVRPHYVSE